MDTSVDRRWFVRAIGCGTVLGLAGCLENGGDGGGNGEGGDDGNGSDDDGHSHDDDGHSHDDDGHSHDDDHAHQIAVH